MIDGSTGEVLLVSSVGVGGRTTLHPPAGVVFVVASLTRPSGAREIVRLPDGRWDVFAVLARWRRSSRVGLRASFRERRRRLPWLDPGRPLAPSDWNELIGRAADVGAKFEAV